MEEKQNVNTENPDDQRESACSDSLCTAFVQGAQWREYRQSKATMWPADRREAEEEAARRVKDGTLGVPLLDRLPKAIGVIGDALGGA